jgi:hypothetical protein
MTVLSPYGSVDKLGDTLILGGLNLESIFSRDQDSFDPLTLKCVYHCPALVPSERMTDHTQDHTPVRLWTHRLLKGKAV